MLTTDTPLLRTYLFGILAICAAILYIAHYTTKDD